jgi:hypothetical protein
MSAEVVPQQPQQVDLKQGIASLRSYAENLMIFDEMSFNAATALCRKVRDWCKMIEHFRKESNAPDQARINARNDKAKELSKPLGEIDLLMADRVARYHAALEEQKRIAAAKIEAYSKLMDEEVPYVPSAEKTLRGDGMVVYSKNEKKFKVVDLAQVPLKYLQLNEDAVKADIKLGVNEIAGLEIFTTTTTQMRSR